MALTAGIDLPAAKIFRKSDSRTAAQEVQSLVRNAVTQNSPDILAGAHKTVNPPCEKSQREDFA